MQCVCMSWTNNKTGVYKELAKLHDKSKNWTQNFHHENIMFKNVHPLNVELHVSHDVI